jgi:general transcription factor 3C polypeptide 3 (transcription factor C subunit 4)
LGEYMSAFKQDPDNPLIALMLGLTFVHMACQKFSARKHSLVVQVKQLSFKFHSKKLFNY